jgi:hypothetical protein
VIFTCLFNVGEWPESKHETCDVVAVCGCQAVPPGTKLPAVCDCECPPCKQAWWAMGRPRVVKGKVVRE